MLTYSFIIPALAGCGVCEANGASWKAVQSMQKPRNRVCKFLGAVNTALQLQIPFIDDSLSRCSDESFYIF